ncbi:MAG TPA: hypothetical protein VF520_16535 [Thermoleophilaceae bacterium]|jgi:hypothetical protein
MSVLVLKLVLTPVLIAGATLVQRRYGPRAGGLLVGLPLTSGPVAFFLAVEQGESFAAASARGTIAGLASEAAFVLVYAAVASQPAAARRRGAARRAAWPCALATAVAAFAAATALLRLVPLPLVPTYAGVIAVLAVARLPLPDEPVEAVARRAPRWDLPARIVVATGLVLALTALADSLGAKLTGLVSPFPIYAGVLAVFTHAVDGPRATAGLLHGVLTGLFAFATFFLVLGAVLEDLGIAASFVAATAAALAVQALTTRRARRRSRA